MKSDFASIPLPAAAHPALTPLCGGIYEIRPVGPLPLVEARAIVEAVQILHNRGTALHGLLVDVRHNSALSMVRLSALIEHLGALRLPLAVICAPEQQILGNLVNNTLLHRDLIAYETRYLDGWVFLMTHLGLVRDPRDYASSRN